MSYSLVPTSALIYIFFNLMKINVTGTSGSGKSTFSKELSALLDVPYIELDLLFWKKNWQTSSDEELNQKLSNALSHAVNGWVLDGNYSRTQPIKWQHVDIVIFLDYSFIRTFYQSVKRTVSRILSQRELWPNTNNKDTWKKAFFSRDSIIFWMLKTYRKNRKQYIYNSTNKQYKHIQFVRLTSKKEAQLFLQLMQQHLNHS